MQNDRNQVASIDPHRWVSRYADQLYAYAITRLNDEEQARDLVQETFLAALEKIHKFEGRSSEGTWLTSILKNKIVDVYRRRSAGLAGNTDTPTEEPDFFDAADGHWNPLYAPKAFGIGERTVEGHDQLMNKELTNALQQCLQKLPSLWLSVFTLKHIDEQSTEIICRDLKVTPANFWVIIHRAKVNLRACLQKNWI